jgi:hypothetical protein
MLKEVIIAAEVLRNKYKLEIEGHFNANDFFKAKFLNDQETQKRIRKNLYKKLK